MKALKIIFCVFSILAVGVGLFCLAGWLYGLVTNQTFVETMHVWLPFLTKK